MICRALLLMFVFSPFSFSNEGKNRCGEILMVSGTVEGRLEDGTWVPAAKDICLYTFVRAGDDSEVNVRLPNGVHVRLTANAEMRILSDEEYEQRKSQRYETERGRVWEKARPKAIDSDDQKSISVELPSVNLEIRG